MCSETLKSRIKKTRLPASRSRSVGPEGCFSFCHPKVKEGEVSFDKNENHGLEMHFKSFEVFLVYVLFLPIPPSSCVVAGLIIVSIQFFPMKF